MYNYMKYGPFLCVGTLLVVLFIIWIFWGTEQQEFVGFSSIFPDQIPPDSLLFSADYKTDIETAPEAVTTVEDAFKDFLQPTGVEEKTEENILLENIADEIKEDSEPEPEHCFKEAKQPKFVSKGEKICREVMERIYGVEFKNIRPDWLKNPETGCNLELDCYNENLKIAVEYNGKQHYEWPNFTNQSQEQFEKQLRRDKFKKERCVRNEVKLITVPFEIPHNEIPAFIVSRLPEKIQKYVKDRNILELFN